MTRDRRRSKVAVRRACVTVVTLMLVGAGFPTKDVSPEKWARSVCGALTEWGEELETASEAFTESESSKEAAGVLEDALDATNGLIKSVGRAGTPDVDDGKATAKAFVGAFKDARKLLEGAVEDASDLPSDDDEFEEALTALDDELGEGFTTVGEDVDAAQQDADPELQTALEEEPDCADIFGQDTGETEPEGTEPDEGTESDLP